MSPAFIPLAEHIDHLPAFSSPLSAEIFRIKGQNCDYFFDVGCGQEPLDFIREKAANQVAVISHFHPDHMGNLHHLPFSRVYLGDYAHEKAQTGICVKAPLEIRDGVHLRILPLPSSHAKGSLIMEVNGQYAFLGDGTYCTHKNGAPVYNATILRETIRTLECLTAPFFILSHASPLVQSKEAVLNELKSIYSSKAPNAPFIPLNA